MEIKCNNTNCTKAHCARYMRVDDYSECEDYNPDNKFKCPNYIPLYKKHSELQPSVIAGRNDRGKIVKIFKYENN